MALSLPEIRANLGINFPVRKGVKEKPIQESVTETTPTQVNPAQRFKTLRGIVTFLKENADTTEKDNQKFWASLGIETASPAQTLIPMQQHERVNDINSYTSGLLEEGQALEKPEEKVIASFPAVDTSRPIPQH